MEEVETEFFKLKKEKAKWSKKKKRLYKVQMLQNTKSIKAANVKHKHLTLVANVRLQLIKTKLKNLKGS